MRLTFLGTGTSQGVPVIGCPCNVCTSEDLHDKRLRSSVRIEVNGLDLVIDSGPDFRQQCLRAGMNKLDGLLFTHGHKDHVAGLDDIRGFNYSMKKHVDIYSDMRVQDTLQREFSYVFEKVKYPGVPELDMHIIENKPFNLKGVEVMPIEVQHHRLPVLGFRIGGFSYITDANFISEKEKQKVRGSEVLVLNALRHEAHVSHFTLAEAIQLSDELEAKQTYFTHISHQMGLHQEINQTMPAGKALAYDQQQLEI